MTEKTYPHTLESTTLVLFFKHNYDKTGNSKVNQTSFYLDEGVVTVSCFDWSEEYNDKNYPDSLRVGMTTSNLSAWFRNKAYK